PRAERGCTLAIPGDRGLRVLVKLPHWRACGPGWVDRLALRAPLRLAERVRQPARPAGRKFSLRTVRDQSSDNADLRARHECPGYDLEIAVRLDCCPRRVDDRPPGSRRQDHTPHPASR